MNEHEQKDFYLMLITKLFDDALDFYADHPEQIEDEYRAILQTIPQSEKMDRRAPFAQLITGFCLGMDAGMKLCEQMERTT